MFSYRKLRLLFLKIIQYIFNISLQIINKVTFLIFVAIIPTNNLTFFLLIIA